MRFLVIIGCALFLFASTGCSVDQREHSSLSTVFYSGSFDVGDTKIPFRFLLDDSTLTLVNAEERIDLIFHSAQGDTLVFGFPQYSAQLEVYLPRNTTVISGRWLPSETSDKPTLAFKAHQTTFSEPASLDSDITSQFAVHFHYNDSSKSFPAILKLASNHQELTGTFLTETGDFRFMEGKIAGEKIWLSTFDGDHLYFATAEMVGKSLKNGLFYSGHKAPYFWSGAQIKYADKHLADADSITTIVGETTTLSFKAQTFSGDTIIFDSSRYHNRVTVVSVFGSWCPNCHDEMRMYAELSREIDNQVLQFVPVAFERGSNISIAEASVKKATNYTGFTHEVYYGGEATKTSAADVFPQLSKIVAFPTTVFIDKNGHVRKIHTGFNGPGTGSDYDEHRKQVSELLMQLLRE